MRRPSAIGALAVLTACGLTGCANATPVPTVPGPLTPSEVAEIVQHDADIRWSALENLLDGAPRPHVEFVAFSTAESWPAVVAECMRDAGVETANVRAGGGLTFRSDGPGERVVFYGCSVAYPVDPRSEGYLSEAQRGYAWDYWTSRTVPCLLGLGYPVPGVPERRDFIRRGYSIASWNPYLLILPDDQGTQPAWADIDAQCPPLPAPFPDFHEKSG